MRHIKLSFSVAGIAGMVAAVAAVAVAAPAIAQGPGGRQLPPQVRANLEDRPFAAGLPEHLRGALMLRPGALVFASFDVNSDSRIDAEELGAGLDRAFAAADLDGSGALSPLEYADWAGRALGARDARPNVGGLDLDLDRTITRAEFDRGFRETAALLTRDPALGLTIADLVEPVVRRAPEGAVAIREDGLEPLPRRP